MWNHNILLLLFSINIYRRRNTRKIDLRTLLLYLNLSIVSLQEKEKEKKKNNREIKETEFPSLYSQRSLVLCTKNSGSAREKGKERMRKNRRILVDCSRWMGHLACSCTGLLALWLQVSSKFRRQWTGITTFQRVCTIPSIGNTF